MKRSVRWKFTIIFAGLMTVAIALIWCINNWFLSGYYQNYKIHTLEKGYRAIDAIIQDEVRNGESSLEDAQAELNSGWKEYQKSKDGSSDMDSADGGSAQSGKNGTGDRAGDETQDALGEYAEGDTVVLEDDSEDASADALDGEEASSGGVRLANVIRELRDRSNISCFYMTARVTRHSSPRRGMWKSCVTGCGAISSVMRGRSGMYCGNMTTT